MLRAEEPCQRFMPEKCGQTHTHTLILRCPSVLHPQIIGVYSTVPALKGHLSLL
ncbi:hypothetical protein EXN66_Car020342 [Channa argus]|uniref:Uncharacterized protein n=1 Tax=Channa argus TaxID=215402 RepID=A0A6G1QQT0_CHAAH|nr:hypothetical protein EXN66_Car020342 [Channa argus]